MADTDEMVAETANSAPVTQPRAYQLELFEESMKRNVIVTMDTGSGKTQIAKLRIEAELERCAPDKLVWFLAPTVVLAEQQHQYLSRQLPTYQSRLICGEDNVEHWSTPTIWEAVLRGIRIVVTTPRILLDTLLHGFVRMSRLCLLVFDEAHHCMKGDDTNQIMKRFYHDPAAAAAAAGREVALPHILGLSASPVTNAKLGALEKLEYNLNAICRAPTRHLDELRRYVHQPQMSRLTYDDSGVPYSPQLQRLQEVVNTFDVRQDPYVKYLEKDGRTKSQEKLTKFFNGTPTDSQKELNTLFRRTLELHEQLGAGASTHFLEACVQKLKEMVASCETMALSLRSHEKAFLCQLLSPVVGPADRPRGLSLDYHDVSPKVMALLKYLSDEYSEGVMGIIFVKERSTAAILARLIFNHPLTLGKYMAEPFVGTSSFARKQTLTDLADKNTQSAALADFRLGKKNLLVCTSVTEEGVDISSMNLVIRFDQPSNFRAFIQSRGRARMVESKFVLMCGEMDPTDSFRKWKVLEDEMKRKYMDEMRQIAQQVEDEDMEDAYDEYLRNDITGAQLSIHDAKGHLEHFCACLPTVPYADPPRPEYILQSLATDLFTADVVLPQSVHILPRRTSARNTWKSQKMATKDAAFQAYSRLYQAGLINQNLLPTALPDPVMLEMDVDVKEEGKMLDMKGRMNPWTCLLERGQAPGRHILTVKAQLAGEKPLPPLHLLLPAPVELKMTFNMFWTANQAISVQAYSNGSVDGSIHDHEFVRLCDLSNQRLLKSVFLHKMKTVSAAPPVYPFLVIPFVNPSLLQTWLGSSAGESTSDKGAALPSEDRLVRVKDWPQEARPYFYISMASRARNPPWIPEGADLDQLLNEEVHYELRRLPKRLDYLHPSASNDFNTAIEFVPAVECYVDPFPATYAKIMLLLPSILHKMELRMVSSSLSTKLLSSVAFQDLGLIDTAISASAANETSNYQRFELIGDSVLKFWTCAHLCAQFPQWHEGYLSRAKDRIVSNAHLCRAAKDGGLDEYIHTEPFASSRWKPLTVVQGNTAGSGHLERKLSSKILADVVEALIGASFLDGRNVQERIIKVKACLSIFLGNISWKSPFDNASAMKEVVPVDAASFGNFAPLTDITGYSFDKIILFVEALTHPSYPSVGVQGTYQRLEFLGDSILDFVVVEEMARQRHAIPNYIMHLIRAGVVNAHLLAFFCMQTRLEQDRIDVKANPDSGMVHMSPARTTTHLWEFMKHSGKLDILEAQKACARRHEHLSLPIAEALRSSTGHPWYLLLSLKADKFFSDIIESILGAIFIDSKGSLEACREFLRRLGLLGYLDRVMKEDVDMMHPKQRLGIVAVSSKVRYDVVKRVVDGAAVFDCTVFIDEKQMAMSVGEVSRAAAQAKAADDAVRLARTQDGKSMEMEVDS